MGGEYRWTVLGVHGWIAAHGQAVAVQRIETRIAIPGLVQVDAIDALCEALFHLRRVVTHAVVGAVGEHAVDRTLVVRIPGQRVGRDGLLDGRRLERFGRGRADDAVAVARR